MDPTIYCPALSQMWWPIKSFLDEDQIQVHHTCTTLCPPGFHNRFYWYGKKQASPGRYPTWIDKISNVHCIVKEPEDCANDPDGNDVQNDVPDDIPTDSTQ